MQSYFPPLKPYAQHEIPCAPEGMLYVEECGNSRGQPLLVCHDGPGLGTPAYYRRLFDPELYRIVLFDQRGCGHSKPHPDLANNTMSSLVNDLDVIRKHLGIKRCHLAGGGFGAMLALAYAQSAPENIAGLLLWNTQLGDAADNDWLYQYGLNRIFPDHYQYLIEAIGTEDRERVLAAYYQRLVGADDIARMSAAKSWQAWIHHCSSYRNSEIPQAQEHHDGQHVLNFAKIAVHYAYNHYFLKPRQLMDGLAKIKHIPARLVHGRYNMLVPLEGVWQLYKEWDKAELMIVRDAAHDETEPSLIDAIIKAGKMIATV